METARKRAPGKRRNSKGPRKGRLARKTTDTAPAAKTVKPPVNLKALNQIARRRKGSHGFGNERTRQCRPISCRMPDKPQAQGR